MNRFKQSSFNTYFNFWHRIRWWLAFSHLSPVELTVHENKSQLLCWFCSGNSDASTPELKTKGGLILFKPGPFSSFQTHHLCQSVCFSVNLRCRRHDWKLLKSCCKRVPRLAHPPVHPMNLKISDLDSQEVKHQIQGLLWASRHLGGRIIWRGVGVVICHQHYQLSHQPYIQMSTSVQRHKERDQTRLWFTFIAFLWPLERNPPAQKCLDNHLSHSCPAAQKLQMTKTSHNSTLQQ